MRRIGSVPPGLLALAVFTLGLIIATALSASGRGAPAPKAMPAELNFKIMLSKWNPVTKLTKVESARMDITVNGATYTTAHLTEGGLMSFSIPTSATSQWTLVSEGFSHRHFRAEFASGFLYLKNEDRNDRPTLYYALSDGSYALEYYQDDLYITNQGQVNGPILGQLNRSQIDQTPGSQAATIATRDTLAPTVTASVGTPGSVNDLALSGNYLYLANGSGGFRIYNIANPASPLAKGTVATVDEARTVALLSNGNLYLGDGSVWREINVTNSNAPFVVGSRDFNSTQKTWRMVQQGNYLYIADEDAFNIRDYNTSSGPPDYVADISSTGTATSVWIHSREAIPQGAQAEETGGSRIITQSTITDAYLADDAGGLLIYEVTNPANPSISGQVAVPAGGSTLDVVVRGIYAYLAQGAAGLQILDISAPEATVEKSLTDTPGDARRVFLSGNKCYVADGTNGLLIYEVSNVSAPVLLATVPVETKCTSVIVRGNYAYIGDGNSFKVVNISATTSDEVPEDDFGGGTDDPTQNPLPPSSVISGEFQGARNTGTGYTDNRVAGFAFGSNPGQGAMIRPLLGGMPGLMYQWVYAGDREPEIFFLPIGEEGILPNGILWEILFDVNSSGVPMLTLLRTFPPEFLIGLAEGNHTMRYWLQDEAGNQSNLREEQILIEGGAEG